RPHSVIVSDDLRTLLVRLNHALAGATALLSGRTITDIDVTLGIALPNIAGVHGHELRRDGHFLRDKSDGAAMRAAAEDLRALDRRTMLPALVENKGASLALHYRHAPDSANEVHRIARDIAKTHGLTLLEGKMVVELLASAITKGDALAEFMQERAFASRTPIMIGDDLTDEHAFESARALGGFGIFVGAARESAADFTLPHPTAVRAWLAAGLTQ
ncbi:MAG TPA: trehalose-phosphatase, partial [Verrucomicrobiae bacterium]|nr:trehalose-phosphatase [Verrucomicrobiae bacterium]